MTASVPAPTLIQLRRDLLRLLSNLRLAIVLLLTIAVFSILGTVIEQGQGLAFYQTNYPEAPALFGFLSWKVLLGLGLDHVYRTWWFLSLLVLLGASLITCTIKTQLPLLRHARTWRYYRRANSFRRLALSTTLDRGSIAELSTLLKSQRYQVFEENDVLYARKGLPGRIGPILVHAAILITLAGSILGSLTGFFAQEMVPTGETFKVQNIFDAGPWSAAQVPKDWSVHVNRFWIDYSPEGRVDQFYSDLSVLDQAGQEVDRQTIHVNKPLRHKGVTMYQADWSIAAVQVKYNNSPVLQIPMALLDTGGQGKLWGTYLPTKPDLSEGVSLIAKDLQGTLLIYGQDSKLITTVRKGMSTEINGVNLSIVDVIGSTGLQIKADPGIPIVYSGFGLIMVGVVLSYLSHSQVWAAQDGDRLYLGGRTNRAQVTFERELLGLVDRLPNPVQSAEQVT
jgi:cytochrome c biogenesis protein